MSTFSENILRINTVDKKTAIDTILEHSKPNSVYFTLLVLSTLIISSGLLLNNGFIIIGGVLVAPILNPLLAVSLAVSIGEIRPIKKMGNVLGKSIVLVVGISVVIALIIGPSGASNDVFDNTAKTAVLYFLVAISSGAAATFALVKKDISEILPGTALAVSIIPPLSLIGIGLGFLNFGFARYYLLVFLLNAVGVIIGSLVVFSLMKFYQTKEPQMKLSPTGSKNHPLPENTVKVDESNRTTPPN